MAGGDRIGFSMTLEHIAHVHDAVNAVAVIDFVRILGGAETEGFRGIQHHNRQRCPSQRLDGLQRGGIGGVPGDDAVRSLFFKARHRRPKLRLYAAKRAADHRHSLVLKGAGQPFVKGLEAAAEFRAARVIKGDIQGKKSYFHTGISFAG